MREYFSAVEGDPLSSSPDSHVLASGVDMIFLDQGNRSMAFIGGDAYCGKCKTVGKIIGGSGCSESARLLNEPTDQRQAVAGDFVRCQCDTMPTILAWYGKGWVIEDSYGGATSSHAKVINTSATTRNSNTSSIYDQCVMLFDSVTRSPLRNIQYRFMNGDVVVAEGFTDATGTTQRVSHVEPKVFQLFVRGI
jgi:hypothetical protein